MIEKLTLLSAVAVLTIFVVPASTSAAEWQLGGKSLEGNATLVLTGSYGFAAGSNGFHGDLHAELTLEPGSTGTLDSLTVTNCKGTGGLTGLNCHGTAQNLPWTIHCNEDGSVTITSISLRNTYTGTSLVTTLTGNVVATGEGGSLDSVTLEGENTFVNGSAEAVVTGSLAASEPGYSCS